MDKQHTISFDQSEFYTSTPSNKSDISNGVISPSFNKQSSAVQLNKELNKYNLDIIIKSKSEKSL
jgi:hypothetical protein